MSAARQHTLRRKVTGAGYPSLYAEVAFDDAGRVRGVAISEPGKFSDTAIGDLLGAITGALNASIAEIRGETDGGEAES